MAGASGCGAMLNVALARAQRACCVDMEGMLPTPASIAAFEHAIVSMFRNEWRLAGHERALRSIAIVDESPEQQYLYPEFLLFQRLFERHGLRAIVAAPEALTLRGCVLVHEDTEIDLVYNRLTDFSLDMPASATLREAYLLDAVVLTPPPRAHALCRQAQSGAADRCETTVYARCNARDAECTARKHPIHRSRRRCARGASVERAAGLFFKPTAGFGSRAAYRGDKLTRRVWQEILDGEYVAQAMVAPGERTVDGDEPARVLKFDLRNYAYDGAVQWVAARLYQGQTTNFRTPGGGFAPVYSAPA